ncbi:MAG: hypothetical protein QM500_00460 [Methylococcales bacterium]
MAKLTLDRMHLLSLICVDLHTEIVLYELNLGKYSAQKEPEWYFSCRVSLILENITSIREMKWLCTRLHNKSSYALSRIHKSVKNNRFELKSRKINSILSFDWPTTSLEIEAITHYLKKPKSVYIEGLSLHPDQVTDCIWGVDHYGCDHIASNKSDDIVSALNWINYQNEYSSGHPAENGR